MLPEIQMLPLEEAKPVHARWSEANREFLEFVERNPAYLRRESFPDHQRDPWRRKFPLQPWPFFAGSAQRRELAATVVGVDKVVKSAFERFFRGDPATVSEYYRIRHPEKHEEVLGMVVDIHPMMIDIILKEPTGIAAAPSRGDYLETPEGLKCMELNVGGFLGGLQIDAISDVYLESPPTARFLREHGYRAGPPGTLNAFYRSLVEETTRIGVYTGGDFVVAMLIHPHEPDQIALYEGGRYEQELLRVLEETGAAPGGKVLLCSPADVVNVDGVLTVDGTRIHAAVEMHDGTADMRVILWHHKHGGINLVGGPVGLVLSDKRNIALVSENAGSDEFTAAERSLIEKHVPWTRRVRPVLTEFRGRGIRLPDDLPDRRQEFVLKKAASLGGGTVQVGRFRTDAEWREAVARAGREGDWIVQEYLEQVPYCFQPPEGGAARYSMVWGLFAFGDHFGGGFLRMQPMGGSGVVNTAQGAEAGVLLNLLD